MQLRIGTVLRACRERAGFSQERLGEMLHHDRSIISRIESEKSKIDAQMLLRWADVTNAKEVLVAYLCGLDGITIMQQVLSVAGIS